MEKVDQHVAHIVRKDEIHRFLDTVGDDAKFVMVIADGDNFEYFWSSNLRTWEGKGLIESARDYFKE